MSARAKLQRDDVVISMPPDDLWMQGTEAVIGWMVGPGAACADSKLLPVSANGTAGFGSYKPAGPGRWEPWALQVIEVRDGAISGHHNFLYPDLFAASGLPPFIQESRRSALELAGQPHQPEELPPAGADVRPAAGPTEALGGESTP